MLQDVTIGGNMASNTTSELPYRTRANAAITLALLSLIVAAVSVALAIGARNRAADAQNVANNTKKYAESTVKKH